jgi:hypothetical protein
MAQGVLKSPWTAVCKLPKKWNSNVSPLSAVTESGLKVKPLCPTLMTTVLVAAVAAMARRRLIDRCIVLKRVTIKY